jgi:hypothetical protein
MVWKIIRLQYKVVIMQVMMYCLKKQVTGHAANLNKSMLQFLNQYFACR